MLGSVSAHTMSRGYAAIAITKSNAIDVAGDYECKIHPVARGFLAVFSMGISEALIYLDKKGKREGFIDHALNALEQGTTTVVRNNRNDHTAHNRRQFGYTEQIDGVMVGFRFVENQSYLLDGKQIQPEVTIISASDETTYLPRDDNKIRSIVDFKFKLIKGILKHPLTSESQLARALGLLADLAKMVVDAKNAMEVLQKPAGVPVAKGEDDVFSPYAALVKLSNSMQLLCIDYDIRLESSAQGLPSGSEKTDGNRKGIVRSQSVPITDDSPLLSSGSTIDDDDNGESFPMQFLEYIEMPSTVQPANKENLVVSSDGQLVDSTDIATQGTNGSSLDQWQIGLLVPVPVSAPLSVTTPASVTAPASAPVTAPASAPVTASASAPVTASETAPASVTVSAPVPVTPLVTAFVDVESNRARPLIPNNAVLAQEAVQHSDQSLSTENTAHPIDLPIQPGTGAVASIPSTLIRSRLPVVDSINQPEVTLVTASPSDKTKQEKLDHLEGYEDRLTTQLERLENERQRLSKKKSDISDSWSVWLGIDEFDDSRINSRIQEIKLEKSALLEAIADIGQKRLKIEGIPVFI